MTRILQLLDRLVLGQHDYKSNAEAWRKFLDTENRFVGTATLDAGEVLEAWERLAMDTAFEDAASMPAIIHASFVDTLKESREREEI